MKIPIEFELEEILVEEVWDQDEDGYGYRYWEEWDTCKIERFEIEVEEEFEFDDIVVIDEALTYLRNNGHTSAKKFGDYRIDPVDVLQFNIYDMREDDKPLYRITLM